MKYLVINGSPHKGNTWLLAEFAMQNLKRIDNNAQFEELHLSELGIPFCTGCSACFRLGYEKCPHFEKIYPVISAIEHSDGIIVSSSTFNMRETALLKNLFDHMCFMLHRPHFFKSKALVITTTGGIGGKSSAKSIASFLKGIGFNRCLCFTAASFSWNSYSPSEKTKKKLLKTAEKFFKDVSSGKLHHPSAVLLIPYNLFRGMSIAYAPGTEFETEDGRYWTDPIRSKRAYDNAVPLLLSHKAIGHLFYSIGKIAGRVKSMQITYRK